MIKVKKALCFSVSVHKPAVGIFLNCFGGRIVIKVVFIIFIVRLFRGFIKFQGFLPFEIISTPHYYAVLYTYIIAYYVCFGKFFCKKMTADFDFVSGLTSVPYGTEVFYV